MASSASSATTALLRYAPSASSGGVVGPWAAQVRRSLLVATLRAAAVANGSAAVKKRNKKGAGGGGLEIREAEEYLTTDVQGKSASRRILARGNFHKAQCIGYTWEGDSSGRGARTCDSWLCKMGNPVRQSDHTCAISACIMCIEALHRIAYEKVNGLGSFGLKVKAGAEEELKPMFKTIGAYIEEVLEAICLNKGLPTDDKNIRLTFKGYDARYCTVSAEDAAVLITEGPVVGGMSYGDKKTYSKFCDDDNTYQGPKEDEKVTPHAVVCVGYKFDSKGLHIKILDNHTAKGPVRWVHYNAFHLFTVITVDAIDPTGVLHTL
ncbi:uncharacterized protein LOC124706073 isoform X2 [Lolium rigidum]|uniref:uncharacterized protein LOC124706073 isoform X2 n=1 Tax=Lolium rigidum TaxID=89674 RepID=UPI001F5D340D|nr:uncharacterized protein LOC124706073 isoform X2 [Lolium rigidum]